MPISFPCPQCKGTVTFGDTHAGQRAPCPRCGAFVAVPAQATDQIKVSPASNPPPEGRATHVAEGPPPAKPAASSVEWLTDLPRARDYETGAYARGEEPQGEEPQGEDASGVPDLSARALTPGWKIVRAGLGMIFWGTLTLVVLLVILMAIIFQAAANIVRQLGPEAAPPMHQAAAGVLYLVLGAAVLVSFLVIFVGLCLCIAAPQDSRARGLAVWSAVASVACGVLYVMLIFVVLASAGGGLAGGPGFGQGRETWFVLFLSLLILISFVTALVLFVLFLKAAGRHFRSEAVVQSARGFLTLLFITGALYLLVNCVGITLRDQQAAAPLNCLAYVAFGLMVTLIVWFLTLVARTRGAIR
jgi:hypothetical protein